MGHGMQGTSGGWVSDGSRSPEREGTASMSWRVSVFYALSTVSSDGDGGRRTGVVPGAPWTSRRLLQQDRLDFVPRMRHKIVARASNKTNDINSTMDFSTGNCSLEKRSFKMVLTQRLKAVHCRRPRLVRPARSPLGPPDFENYQRFPQMVCLGYYFLKWYVRFPFLSC